MRIDVPWVISVLAGVLIGGVLVVVLSGSPKTVHRSAVPRATSEVTRPAVPRPTPVRPVEERTPPSPSGLTTAPPSDIQTRPVVAADRLREMQQEYLITLLRTPGDPNAMAGLVTVQRQLAQDDPTVLRRQAAALEKAIARGTETEEHYTPNAMMILAEASLLAAQEIERERGTPSGLAATVPPIALSTVGPDGVGRNATPRARVQTAPSTPPAATRRRRTPRPPRAAVTSPPSARPASPVPATVAPPQTTPAPQVSLDVNEPFFMVQAGPIFDAARASEIATELILDGYAARVSRPAGGSSYFIVLGPYRRSVAAALAKTIRARYGGLGVTLSPAP